MNLPDIARLLARRRNRPARKHVDLLKMPAEAFHQHFHLLKITVQWLYDNLQDGLNLASGSTATFVAPSFQNTEVNDRLLAG